MGEANVFGTDLVLALLSFACRPSSKDSKVTACFARPGIDLLDD